MEQYARTYDLLLGNALTHRDPRPLLLLRTTTDPDARAALLHVVLDKRAKHRAWVTTTQRKWQAKTRRPQRANHHDSISIRERYVRCV